MTIRNDNLGGSDFTDGEVLKAVDLNDTFDATVTRASTYAGFEKYTLVQTLTPSGSGQNITLEVGKRYAITVDLTPVSGEGLYNIRINSNSSSVYNYARIYGGASPSTSSADNTSAILLSGTNLKGVIKCGALSNASDSNYYFSTKIEAFDNNHDEPGENVLVGSYETGISSSTYILNLINNMTGTIKVYEVDFL